MSSDFNVIMKELNNRNCLSDVLQSMFFKKIVFSVIFGQNVSLILTYKNLQKHIRKNDKINANDRFLEKSFSGRIAIK